MRALRILGPGRADLSVLVSETLPLAAYERGVALLRERRALKVSFVP